MLCLVIDNYHEFLWSIKMADSRGTKKLRMDLVKATMPNTILTTASKRLQSAMVDFYGSEELAEFAMNTLAENFENDNEVAFIKTVNGKVRIKRYIFANDDGEKDDKGKA